MARSADAGSTTATATVATPQTVTTADGAVKQDYRYTDIAVDPSNPKRLYAAWQVGVTTPSNGKRSGLPPTQAVIATSSDGGATWSLSRVSAAASGMSLYGAGVPSLVVASDGAVYAVSKEVPKPAASGPPPPARFIMFASTDHGAHWAASEVPDQAGKAFVEPPVMAADPQGRRAVRCLESGRDHAGGEVDHLLHQLDGQGQDLEPAAPSRRCERALNRQLV